MSYFDLGFLSQVQNKIPRSRLGSSSCSSSSLLQTMAAVLWLSKHLLTFTRRLTDFIVSHLQLSGHIYLHTLLPLPTHPPFFFSLQHLLPCSAAHFFVKQNAKDTQGRKKKQEKQIFHLPRQSTALVSRHQSDELNNESQ